MTGRKFALVAGLLAVLAAAGLAPWLGPDPAEDPVPLRLVLNIPAYRLDVYEHGERTRSFMVSVGQPGHQTPAGEYEISQVIWNPWWHPPKSDWARGRKATAPGPNNPMGRVKLNFAPLYYVHGSPEGSGMGLPASHGCVRMTNEEVMELARLVQRHATPDVSAEELERLAANPGQTRPYRLRRPVPLEVRYDVVEVADGRVHVHRDVYRKAASTLRERVVSALEAAGYAASRLDASRVDELVAMARRQPVIVPIDNLLGAGEASAASPERGR